jgi:hypothetical protein
LDYVLTGLMWHGAADRRGDSAVIKDDLLQMLAGLRQAPAGGIRAPHKPLLLLWLFGRIAVTGVAFGKATGRPLGSGDFSGGVQGAAGGLRALGFEVRNTRDPLL